MCAVGYEVVGVFDAVVRKDVVFVAMDVEDVFVWLCVVPDDGGFSAPFKVFVVHAVEHGFVG